MSRRDGRRDGGGCGRLLFWLAVAGLVYWAGRDPSGAVAVLHAIGQGLAHLGHGHTTDGRS
jgi:hypothetical protein